MNLEDKFEKSNTINEQYALKIKALQHECNVEIEKLVGDLEAELRAFIKDKSIPIMERFDIWCKAPDKLVENLSFLPHFQNHKLRSKFFNAREFYRHEEVDVRQLLSDYIDDEGTFDAESFSLYKKLDTDEIEEIVEEFMAQNLGYFTFDW